MDGPQPVGILATDYARQIGVSKERVYQMIQERHLDSYRVREGGRLRVYVIPRPKVVDAESPNGALAVSPDSAAADSPVAPLDRLSEYNTRLIAPWVERVTELEGTIRQQAVEIGDLRRQVRQLQRRLEGLMALVEQRASPE